MLVALNHQISLSYDNVIRIIIATLIAYYGFYVLYFIFFKIRANQTYKIGQKYKQARDKKVFMFPQVDEQKQKIILKSKLEELRQLQIQGKLTSVEIVSTYSQRCYSIGRQLNLVTEELYDNALLLAAEKDTLMQKARQTKDFTLIGAFHGIPFSFKDQIQIKGVASTVGCSFLTNNIDQEDANIVKVIRQEGGIPFVKSNVPQMTLSLHTDNPIFGQAQNPYDETRNTGGSSGGEGGLLAARCSPIGIGTDILGSVRNPALFCGVNGFRPTPERFSWQSWGLHVKYGLTFMGINCPTAGPISKNVEDLIYAMKNLMTDEMFKRDYHSLRCHLMIKN